MQRHSCSLCAMSQICLPLGIEQKDLAKLEDLISTSATMHSGDIALHQGNRFDKIYAVKTGTLKSYRVDEQGNEHVVAFHLPGELFGLDAIYPEKYTCSTKALDTAVLCEMDYQELSELCRHIPTLQQQLLRLLSRDIHVSQITHADNTEQTAEQKLASFLHTLSARFQLRGYSGTEFMLAMTRQDIANHLGMAPETMSRLLKRFKQQNILDIQNRQITLKNPNKLEEIIQCKAA